jgi:hypothetical protein
MPPRYAYWTILVDDTPTAFRAGSQEDLMPTFKRLKAKHPSATMMWFQNGKLWPSRVDAQEAMHARGEMGRRGDERQGGFRDRGDKPFSPRRDTPSFPRSDKPAWKPKSFAAEGREPRRSSPASEGGPAKLDWKAKGDFVPAPKRDRSFDSDGDAPKAPRAEKPDWKPKGAFTPAPRRSEKPDWKPKSTDHLEWKAKGDFVPAPRRPKSDDRERKPAWGSNASSEARKASYSDRPDRKTSSYSRPAKRDWTPKSGWTSKRPAAAERPARSERPDWKPKASTQESEPGSGEKRKWVPKEEYKKSRGIEAKKDKNWRPGGDHKDPRQKYKDAKKAKWTKFKKAIRTRSEGKKNKDS